MGVSFWKKDVDNTVEIDLGARDVYDASGFAMFTKFADETAPTKQDVTFTELVEEITDAVTVKTVGDTSAGSKEIGIDDTSKVSVGMRLDAGNGNIFYVSAVKSDSIITRRPLKADIADDTTLNQVGNLGIYETTFKPEKTGALVFVISNASIGLQNESAKVQVVNELVDDLAGSFASAKDDVNTKLDNIASAIGVDTNAVVGKILA